MSDEVPESVDPPALAPEPSSPELYAPPVAVPLPAEPERRAWPWGLLLGLLNYPAIGLVMTVVSNVETLWCGLPVLILLSEVVFGAVKLKTDRFVGRVLLFGPVFTIGIAVVGLLVFFGICLISGTGMNFQ